MPIRASHTLWGRLCHWQWRWRRPLGDRAVVVLGRGTTVGRHGERHELGRVGLGTIGKKTSSNCEIVKTFTT